MTLRRVTALIVGISVLGTAACVFALSHLVTGGSFSQLEHDFAHQDVERAQNAILNEAEQLDTTAIDWASWDSTYEYVQSGDKGYELENLTLDTLETLDLNYFVIVALDGSIVQARGLDRETGEPQRLPDDFVRFLPLQGRPVPPAADRFQASGILLLHEAPLLFAIRPVLQSNERGPARGFLVMARYLDEATLGRLADQTVLNLSIAVADGPADPEITISEAPDNQLISSGTIPAGPARHVVVSVTSERQIAAAAAEVSRWMLVVAVGVAFAFGALIFFFLHRFVVRRLHRLSSELGSIAVDPRPLLRVTVDGSDEIAHLANDINSTLASREAALRRFETLVETSADAIYLIQEGRIAFANPAAGILAGTSPTALIGLPASAIVSPPDSASFVRAVAAAAPGADSRLEATSTDGTRQLDLAVVQVTGQPGLAQVMARDITERRKREAADREFDRNVLESQRLESLGLFAGGIAHDFNNILLTIAGNAALARIDEDPTEAIAQIEAAAFHAADLTRQLLAYAGGGQLQVRRVPLEKVVDETARLVRRVAPSIVTIEIVATEDGAFVEGDEVQLRQVVMNLVTNAFDALGETQGKIVISTGVRHFDETELSQIVTGHSVGPGEYAFVRVADTGPGISTERLARIFEPFVSSKGQGRGLGLSAVAGIVRAHHGAIAVDSSPGRGATFTVVFPEASGEAAVVVDDYELPSVRLRGAASA